MLRAVDLQDEAHIPTPDANELRKRDLRVAATGWTRAEYYRALTLRPARAHSAPHDHANQLYFILAHCTLSDNMTMPFTGIGLPCQSNRHGGTGLLAPRPFGSNGANMRSVIGGTAEIA
jgi:hypothetical protein